VANNPDDSSRPRSKVLPERGVAQITYESKSGRITMEDGNRVLVVAFPVGDVAVSSVGAFQSCAAERVKERACRRSVEGPGSVPEAARLREHVP
jgi:hypothetical protein